MYREKEKELKPRHKEDDYGCQLKQEEEEDGDEWAADVVEQLMILRREEVAHLPAATAGGMGGFRRRP